ncbi:MAG TPA: AMP-binding protein [Williamwhitmania sp.]|nr:AMP-binding protein [Williamwhitmania sp.]
MIKAENISSVAIVSKNEKIPYGQLFGHIAELAQTFSGKGYTRVAIYAENRPEWIYAFYAAWKNGCTVIPIDFSAAADDVAYIINDCKPDLLFASNTTKEALEKIQPNLQHIPEIAFLNEQTFSQNSLETGVNQPADIESTAVIIYTSGTTGNPKGVMLSFRNLLANIEAVSKDVKIFDANRQVLILLPLHHIFPLVGSLVAPLFVGASVVIAPSMQSSDLLETLKQNEVAIMIGVPRLYELLFKGLKAKLDSSFVARNLFAIVRRLHSPKLSRKIFKKVHDGFGGHLEIMVAGGAALNKEVGRFFRDLGFDVLEGYGMTEASPMITFTRPGKLHIGSPGQPLPNMQVEIRDGEIVAKGPNIMQGYYNRPEETAEVVKDGWLYTGDLGRIDKKGYLYITGRKKEIIVLSNGKNVNPVELEAKLEKASPCIREAGVFMSNDQLHAVILPDLQVTGEKEIKDIEKYFREEVIQDLNSKLSSYKRIMQFTIIREELPRTKLGKIQRFKLSEMAEKPTRGKEQVAQPTTVEYLAVKTFIESQVDMDISPNDHIEFDIALDSLGKLNLIDYIEKTFGVTIEEDRLLKFPSVKDISEYISEKKKWFKEGTHNWSEALREKVDVKLPKTWPTQNFLKNVFKTFFKLYFRFHGEGMENIPMGPCIIAPNHQSFFDGLFVAAFLRRKIMKKTYFYAKKKHVNNGFLRFMANTNNVIVMDTNKDLLESIQKLAEVLKNGRNIIIFPEGTRTTTGEVGEFKKTFAILSTELNIPVVPVAIEGAFDALPHGSKFPKIGTKVHIKFLPAVYPEGNTPDSLAEKVQREITQRIAG